MSGQHVAVIGAGVVGAASALELLRAGYRVTLIDPAEPGGEQAASYGNAGWLSSHSVSPPAMPGAWKHIPSYLTDPLGPLAVRARYLPRALPWLTRYLYSGATQARVETTARALRSMLFDAPALHARLAREAEVSHLVEQHGLLHAYRSRADYLADAFGWKLRRDAGIALTEWDTDTLRAQEPDLHPRYTFGVWVAEAGRCRNVGAYTAALVDAALVRGAELQRTRALGFEIVDARLKAVRTEAGRVACDYAVICAGARANALAAAAGDPVPLETERGYHAVITDTSIGPRTSTMAMDCKIIVNATDTGLRVAGQVEIAGLDASPNWARAHILRDLLLTMYPGLPQPPAQTQLRYWMGHRPSLPDGLPCIGHAQASRDVVHAFGHGHVGLGSSARTGRLVAQLISGAKLDIDIAPFDPRRFRSY